MKYWLQALSENGFDVFIVVYLAVLFLAYHYLLRWYIDLKLKNIEKRLNLNSTYNKTRQRIQPRCKGNRTYTSHKR